jgi:DHA1 family bicyclomycin/chloramphenicol resistance-like MFS transporter
VHAFFFDAMTIAPEPRRQPTAEAEAPGSMSELRTAVVGALIVALGAVSLSLYTPALPTLVQAFGTTPATIKLTLSVYFCGFAFAQLVCGPLSDAYGRKPVALAFYSIYLAGSVMAAMSPTVGWLLAGRALQGIGVAAGITVSRAIVRDQFTGQASARIMNLIGLMLAIGPAVSPTIGGLVLSTVGWHAIFLLMVVYGVAVVVILAVFVRETNRAPDAAMAHPARVLRNYALLLGDRRFMRSGLVLGLTLGGIYTLAALLPFVLIDKVGLTPVQFGLGMMAQTCSYFAGAALTGRLLRQVDSKRLVPAGLALVLLGAAWFAIGLRLVPPSLVTVMGPVGIWAFGNALIIPGATTGALAGFGSIAGAASALTGFLQIGGGLAGSAIGALLFADPFTALTTIVPIMAVLAGVAFWVLGPRSPERSAEAKRIAGGRAAAADEPGDSNGPRGS